MTRLILGALLGIAITLFGQPLFATAQGASTVIATCHGQVVTVGRVRT